MDFDVDSTGVPALAARLTGDPAIADEIRRGIAARRIARALLFARNAARLSQREVARRMGVSAATVCRMEEQPDAAQLVGNVANYLGALGLRLSTTISNAPREPIRIMGTVWCEGGVPGRTTPRAHRAGRTAAAKAPAVAAAAL